MERKIDGPIKIPVFIDIEHAPVLVEGLAAPSLLLAKVGFPAISRCLHQLERSTVEIVYHDDDPITVEPVPLLKVEGFCLPALSEDQDLAALSGPRPSSPPGPPRSAPHPHSPGVGRTAAENS